MEVTGSQTNADSSSQRTRLNIPVGAEEKINVSTSDSDDFHPSFNMLRIDDDDDSRASRLSLTPSQNQEILEEQQQTDIQISALQEQLRLAQVKLCEREKETMNLRATVDNEIQELTASLFEEANKMVNDANKKRVMAEKRAAEAASKAEILNAEVKALKTIIASLRNNSSPTKKQHRRILSDSNKQLTAGNNSSPLTSIDSVLQLADIDPVLHHLMVQWRNDGTNFDQKDHPFIRRLFNDDISPCLDFQNKQLESQLIGAIESNTLVLEKISDLKPPTLLCGLSMVPRCCPYRLRFNNEADALHISQFCRNRIAAVCDLYTYMRYLKIGLIKCGVHDSYAEFTRLRRNIALARLGLVYSDDALNN